jgi:hypothetical protein
LEFTQQESVALGELAAQNEQRPCKFDWNPQSFGSFCAPAMQDPLRELAGRAQFVKSALIWLKASRPESPHNSGLAVISCSLMAKSAYRAVSVPPHELKESQLHLHMSLRKEASYHFQTPRRLILNFVRWRCK